MKGRINTERSVEDELKVRPGGGHRQPRGAAGGHWEFRGKGVGHRLHRLGRRSSGRGSGADPRQQRVVVKAAYTVHKAGSARGVLAAHTRYLARDSASLDGREGRFYNAANEGVDAKQQVREWEADRHHFRFIVSPENGAEIDRRPGGMAGYVREVMARVERDLGTKLEWVAITHHNTDDLHAHVLVRGRRTCGQQDDGKDLVIPRQYLQHGMRQAAAEVATRWIGPRSAEQVDEAARRELTANRYIPLDAAIERRLDADRQLRLRDDDASPEGRRRMAARLAHLEMVGLAERDRHGRWTVDANLRQTLRDLAERDDILKNLYPKLGPRAGAADRYGGEPVAGRVVGRGGHDELRDQRYVAVQDAAGQLHYVLPANPRALGPLEEGGVVRVSGSDPKLVKTDARIAELARANGGRVTAPVYDSRTGTTLLVPQGGRLYGGYDSRVSGNQNRVLLVWHRLLMPNGRSVELDRMRGTDAAGYAGVADGVDYHADQLALGAALSGVIAYAGNLARNGQAAQTAAADTIGDTVAQQAARTGSRIVDRQLDAQPTITVRPGWPVRVLVNRDVTLEPYAD